MKTCTYNETDLKQDQYLSFPEFYTFVDYLEELHHTIFDLC